MKKDSETENGLQRRLGLFPVLNIVIANMIGTGIFTTSGLLMQGLHIPMLMIGLWGAAGIIALCGALCYGELGAAFPRAGGEYVFLSELYHPILGFLSGWVSLVVGFSAPIAAASIGVSAYWIRAFPGLLTWVASVNVDPLFVRRAISMAVLIGFTLVHLRGLKTGARVQNVLTVAKILFIAGLIILGFTLGRGSLSHFHAPVDSAVVRPGWKTLGLSIMWILFAYSGWNAATYMGSEIKNPRRNLPRSLIFGTLIVMFLYMLLNLLYVYAVPAEAMKGVISIGGLAVGRLFGAGWERIFSFLIGMALFSSISAYIMLGPRVCFAMARDGCFFNLAGRVNPETHAPSGSILIQTGLAAVMIMTGTFDQILTYMGFALGIFPILAVFGVFKLRRIRPGKSMIPLFPLPPLVYGVSGVMILILAFMARPVESSIALAVVCTGIPAYALFMNMKKRRGQ
ncbi:MAG TPA: amino acid permease [bacterium]|nr:amino acid permease [bacterium]